MRITYGYGDPANMRGVDHADIKAFLKEARQAYEAADSHALYGVALSLELMPGDGTRYAMTIARSHGARGCIVVLTSPGEWMQVIEPGGWFPIPGDDKIGHMNKWTQGVLSDVVRAVVFGKPLRWYNWDIAAPIKRPPEESDEG